MNGEIDLPAAPPRARKSLGQNFLVDPNLQRRIVSALGAGPRDEVLEIGPGRGALTGHLAGRVGRLTLVELDNALAEHWRRASADRVDVDVVHRSVLDLPLDEVSEHPEKLLVVGNIPYNITTPILFHLLERPRPARIVLMVQKEVGERIVAEVATRAYGALAVGVRSVASARICFGVGRRAFRPVPGVDSVVVEITPHVPERTTAGEERDLRRLTRAAFQWRRKQFQKTLRDHPDLQIPSERVAAIGRALEVDLTRRPETFDPDALLALARAIR